MSSDTWLDQSLSWPFVSYDKHDVILSSRIVMNRNLPGIPFPEHATEDQSKHLLSRLVPALLNLKHVPQPRHVNWQKQPDLAKELICEHLMLPASLPKLSRQCDMVLAHDVSWRCLINGKDHLNMSFASPGIKLKTAWRDLNKIVAEIAEQFLFAYDDSFGYLMADPERVGFGVTVEARLLLPGIAMRGQLPPVQRAAHAAGLELRANTKNLLDTDDNVFTVIKTDVTRESVESDLDTVTRFATDLAKQEYKVRCSLDDKRHYSFRDQISRAWGALTCAKMMTEGEALFMLSMLRMGLAFKPGEFAGADLEVLQHLMSNVQSAQLREWRNQMPEAELVPLEHWRTQIIRHYLAQALPG